MEQRSGSEETPKDLAVEEVLLSMGVSSVRALARITEEIARLEANGHVVDVVEHTRRMLTRVE